MIYIMRPIVQASEVPTLTTHHEDITNSIMHQEATQQSRYI